MKKILFIWQLGVNIIGLPEILKVTETKQNYIFVGKGRNKDYKLTIRDVNHEQKL